MKTPASIRSLPSILEAPRPPDADGLNSPRRRMLGVALAVPVVSWTAACGGGGDAGSAATPAVGAAPAPPGSPAPPPPASPAPPAPSPAPAPSSPAVWALGQTAKKEWNSGDSTWTGGDSVSLPAVQAGSTLVLCVYGIRDLATPAGWADPVDSLPGQVPTLAVDTGYDGRTHVQATAWVMHNAAAGTHTWTRLPGFVGSPGNGNGDGMLFFAEFRNGNRVSSTVLGANTKTAYAQTAPLTEGSVTMSTGANAGDLLVAFSFEEEASTGNASTPYTNPPAGWNSLGAQNDSTHNIAGAACWRVAPDNSAQTVSWSWTLGPAQDPAVFMGVIFAVHAP